MEVTVSEFVDFCYKLLNFANILESFGEWTLYGNIEKNDDVTNVEITKTINLILCEKNAHSNVEVNKNSHKALYLFDGLCVCVSDKIC